MKKNKEYQKPSIKFVELQDELLAGSKEMDPDDIAGGSNDSAGFPTPTGY